MCASTRRWAAAGSLTLQPLNLPLPPFFPQDTHELRHCTPSPSAIPSTAAVQALLQTAPPAQSGGAAPSCWASVAAVLLALGSHLRAGKAQQPGPGRAQLCERKRCSAAT